MRNLIKILLPLLFLTSCTNSDNYHNPFRYDKIMHYTVVLDKQEELEYLKSFSGVIESDSFAKKQTYNKALFDIVYENGKISSLGDVENIKQLEAIGYTKNSVPPSNFYSIDSTFRINHSDIYEETECEPVYRDILVFEKNGDITGWAKYCFECHKFDFIGISFFDRQNRYDIDFEMLEDILKNNLLQSSKIE